MCVLTCTVYCHALSWSNQQRPPTVSRRGSLRRSQTGRDRIFDRAYVDFIHLGVLNGDGVFWVTRSKESLCFRVVKKLPKATDKRILRDELVVLKNKDSRANYHEAMRRVRALVEVDGKEREMEFLTNNLQWSARSVADLYRCRWQIEVFFKQIKQSLQLCDFLGNSANAVRWQVWTALLLYVLMRFLCVISRWNHSFTRLFTLLRAALWRKIDLWDLLRFCGQQVDIFDISRLRNMPISQDSLSNPMGQHRDQTEKIFPRKSINS